MARRPVTNFCHRIQELEKQVKHFMRDFPDHAIKTHFSEPASIAKYLKTERLWNESDNQFNDLGFSILQQYIASCLSVTGDAIWHVYKEIYKKQLELTPQEARLE